MTDLQRVLRRARGRAGGRGHLAKLLAVPKRTLQDWESGHRTPPPFTAAAVVAACRRVRRKRPKPPGGPPKPAEVRF